MHRSHCNRRCGSTRRSFLASAAAAGIASGVPLGWYGLHRAFAGRSTPASAAQAADLVMPGKHRGKVVEVNHPASVRADHSIDADVVGQMMGRGLAGLTGADHSEEAWKAFFSRGDVVGIKVNPVGRWPKAGDGRVPGAVGCVSSPAVVVSIVEGLKSAGVRPQDIIVFERYADEFHDAGYVKLMREPEMAGTRWFASSAGYSESQLEIDGFGQPRSRYSPDVVRHVVGYDADQFVTMDFDAPQHDAKDDRRFRSHLSVIVTRMVDKVINVPCLKDHRSAGITGALKNMSHGMNNNVARSHAGGAAAAGTTHAQNNRCLDFIPLAVDQRPLKEKVVLHIMDGLIGVYEGGPGCWNQTWGSWHRGGLFFATDPVAMDRICWEIIDQKRKQMGLLSVGATGLNEHSEPRNRIARGLAYHGLSGPLEQVTLRQCAHIIEAGFGSEVFSMRQPDHVRLAGEMGLGVYDRNAIQYTPLMLEQT